MKLTTSSLVAAGLVGQAIAQRPSGWVKSPFNSTCSAVVTSTVSTTTTFSTTTTVISTVFVTVPGTPSSAGTSSASSAGPINGDGDHFVSTIATGTAAFPSTIVSLASSMIHTGPAPTYSAPAGGNGTVPSNTTVPTTGGPGTSCNSAADRSKWCYGLDINTDAYTIWPNNTGNICSFDFNVVNTTIDYDGTPRLALAVNGQVPGPLIECNWGDIVRINVTNSMQDNTTTIHWHGIRQIGTNPSDGASSITECPLAPGQWRIYQWQATSHGSSWYHAHVGAQYAEGVKGPMIIHGPSSANYDVDMGNVMVDELYNVTANQLYSISSHTGPQNASNYLLNGKNTKPDLSAGAHSVWEIESGKKYLFRIVNSASQSMWKMHFDNHQMTVIAMDFTSIVPYTTDWLSIGIGQRYDVIIEANQTPDSYFFRAVSQLTCPGFNDNTGLGKANGIIKYAGTPDVLPTSTYGNVNLGSFAVCEDEPIASLVPWVVKSVDQSGFAAAAALPVGQPAAVVTTDNGVVVRWYLAGNTMSVNPTNPTLSKLATSTNGTGVFSVLNNAVVLDTPNKWYYFVIQNQFFAAHPMHEHGHDFSVLGSGDGIFNATTAASLNFVNPPRRDTTLLRGAGWTVIAFQADNPGAWLMHCHILWHVMGGLSIQFIERPAEIPANAWTTNSAYTNQCAASAAFELSHPVYPELVSDSGLKKRSEGVETPVEKRAEAPVGKRAARFLKEHMRRKAHAF